MLAVGSDYNLLLVSRFQEELHAGLKTAIVRSMGSTGGVVTTAGLVFAFTMGSMVSSDYGLSAKSAPPSCSDCCSTPWLCVPL